MLTNSCGLYYELDHRYLVDECGSVLTLAAFYGAVAVWCKQRKNGVYLLFSDGLRIMGYGAQCIGGSREVRAAPSKGTTVYRPSAIGSRAFLFYDLMNAITTNREKIACRRGGRPSSAVRRAQAPDQQPAGPRLCRGRGRPFGRQTAR